MDLFLTVIDEWAWIGWVVLIALFLVIEMLTLDFTFLMLSLGGTAGLITDLLGAPLWLQVIIAAAAAGMLILLLRPPLLKRLRRGGDPAKSNVEALIGLRGIVLQPVDDLRGQVKLVNGDIWTARAASSAPISVDSPVIVTEIIGASALVRPATPDPEELS